MEAMRAPQWGDVVDMFAFVAPRLQSMVGAGSELGCDGAVLGPGPVRPPRGLRGGAAAPALTANVGGGGLGEKSSDGLSRARGVGAAAILPQLRLPGLWMVVVGSPGAQLRAGV